MSSTAPPTHDDIAKLLNDIQHLNLSGSVVYESKRAVARGGYGSVFKGIFRDDVEREVAVKRHTVYENGGDRRAIATFIREIKAWSRLNHPNNLPLLGYTLDGDGEEVLTIPALVSKWMDNGNILGFVKRNPDCDIPMLALGMANGLAYLHRMDIVHSDIKSANVLVSPQEEAVICDFGCASVTHGPGSANETAKLRGSTRWLAHELIAYSDKYKSATKESDVWAYAMTVYEMLTKGPPYADLSNDQQVEVAIAKERLPYAPPGHLEPGESLHQRELTAICVSCWKCEPNIRFTMLDVCYHVADVVQRTRNYFPSRSGHSSEGDGQSVMAATQNSITQLPTQTNDVSSTSSSASLTTFVSAAGKHSECDCKSRIGCSPIWKTVPRVLVIEEDIGVQSFLDRLLNLFGCDVEMCPIDKIADKLTRAKYELVLMGKAINNQEALQAIKNILNTTPVIAMVNSTNRFEATNYYRRGLGINRFLVKPPTIQSVIEMVKRNLGHLTVH